MAAGEDRLEAAALNKIPQVVSVGALDMVNFGPISSVPSKYAGRNFYKHNPTVYINAYYSGRKQTIRFSYC